MLDPAHTHDPISTDTTSTNMSISVRAPSPARSQSSQSAQTLADRDVQDLEKGDLRNQLKAEEQGSADNDATDEDDVEDADQAPAGKEAVTKVEEDPFHVTPKGRMHLHPHTWSVPYRWFLVRLSFSFRRFARSGGRFRALLSPTRFADSLNLNSFTSFPLPVATAPLVVIRRMPFPSTTDRIRRIARPQRK